MKRKRHPEDNLENMVSEYLQSRYPQVIFRFDSSAGAKKTMFQAQRFKKLHGKRTRGHPDLFLYEARGGYHGLLIELKVVTPFKKDGTLKKSEHLEIQAARHEELRERGYKVEFGVGFDKVKRIIDEYLSNT